MAVAWSTMNSAGFKEAKSTPKLQKFSKQSIFLNLHAFRSAEEGISLSFLED